MKNYQQCLIKLANMASNVVNHIPTKLKPIPHINEPGILDPRVVE